MRPPPGYRYRLDLEAVRREGLPGGHTLEAWAEALARYGDVLREASARPFGFLLPDGEVRGRVVRYEVRIGEAWRPVEIPKALLAARDLPAIQRHIAPALAVALRPPAPGERLVSVPVLRLSGEPDRFGVRVSLDGAGRIQAWWPDPEIAGTLGAG